MQKDTDGHETLQFGAVTALTLFISNKTEQAFVRMGGLSALVAAVKKFPLSYNIHQPACSIISSLSSLGKLSDEKLSGFASTLLYSLLCNGAHTDENFECDVLETVALVVRHSDVAKRDAIESETGVWFLKKLAYEDTTYTAAIQAQHVLNLLKD